MSKKQATRVRVRYIDVSGKCTASIFIVEKLVKRITNKGQAARNAYKYTNVSEENTASIIRVVK
jgi:hypothetical protein